tara:strand:- start:1802 stop:5413 length:3612 start_codon:yes stop_codon:yes gene_type:complete
MANYPKITSNGAAGSASRKLDRPVLTNKNFFQVSLEDSVSGKQYVYGVVIIESTGDANTSVSISDIHIKNELGTNMSTYETNGSRQTIAVQDAYFTLSPLKKTSAGGWANNVPFMGVVKADFSTEKVKTAAWAAGSGTNDLPAAVKNEIGAGPLSYIKVNLNAEGSAVDSISDAATPFADAENIIPIYNHAYIEANPIPTGQYAAILIKGDVTSGMFSGVKENVLSISHDSTSLSSGLESDYNIKLQLTADNVFIFSTSFGGVNFTNSASHSSSTFARTIKHIATDADTGTSWHARDTTNELDVAVYNIDDGLLYLNHSYNVPISSGGASFTTATYHTNNTFQDDDIVTAWGANGYSFEEAELLVSDSSSVPDEFNLSAVSAEKFYTQSENPLPSSVDQETIKSIRSYQFRHTKASASEVYTTSSISLTETKDKDSQKANLYPNFLFTTKETAEVSISGIRGDDLTTKTLQANYLVYPQFTYGSTAITNYGEVVNLYNDSTKAVSDIVHKSDTYNQINTPSSKYCPILNAGDIYSDYGTIEQNQIITQHNVRINVLNAHDEIQSHGLIAEDGYYKGTGTVAAHIASDENGFTADNTVVSTTAVPDLTAKKIDYTISIGSNVPATPYPSLNLLLPHQHLIRNTDGSYKDMNKNGGFYTNEENFVAPITNWQPGYRHGRTWGTSRIPYYHNVYATGQPYKNFGAYNLLRPLLQIGGRFAKFSFGSKTKNRLEFISAPGLSPSIADVQSGIVNYSPSGTTTHLENSKEITCSDTTNRDRITDLDNNAGSKPSQIAGAEVFGLDALFVDEGRLFVLSYTAVSGGKGFTTLVKEDGTAAECQVASTADEVRVQFGKPTFPATVKRADFAFTDGIASAKTRSRIFRPYGYDLTCSINRNIKDVISGDVFVPTSVDASDTLATASHNGGSTVINKLYTANATTTGGAVVDILDLDPKERGITFGPNSEIESARFHDAVSTNHAQRVGDSCIVFYKDLNADHIESGNYVGQLGFDLFNIGHEDVLIKKAVLFDPMYLPEGNYAIKPEGAQDPTWSLTNVTHERLEGVSGAASFGTGGTIFNWGDKDLNAPAFKLTDILRTKRTFKDAIHSGQTDYLPSNTSLVVNFSVPTSSANGVYFKVLEIDYYRDEGITQNKKTAAGFDVRVLEERRVWTTRVLIEVTVEQNTKIEVTDTDGTVVQQDGSFDFGTIIQ